LIEMSAVDHDDVRILAQERAERRCKRQASLVVDVHLVDAGHLDFGRVFCRGDVDSRLVQQVQAAVKRHRLARSRWACNQDHAVGPLDRVEQAGLFVGVIAQGIDAHLGRTGVKNTDDDFFAEQGGQGAYAEVDHPVNSHLELHASVLRHAFFRNVQARDHLDARSQLVLDGHRGRGNLPQLTVNAEANPIGVLEGLEVQVRSAHADGVQQHLVQEFDNRRVVNFRRCGLFLLIGHRLHRRFVELEVFPDDVVHGLRGGGGVRLHHSRELVVFGDDPVHAHLRGKFDLLCGLWVRRVRRCNRNSVVALGQYRDTEGLADLHIQ
jgi:hypothetical protein